MNYCEPSKYANSYTIQWKVKHLQCYKYNLNPFIHLSLSFCRILSFCVRLCIVSLASLPSNHLFPSHCISIISFLLFFSPVSDCLRFTFRCLPPYGTTKAAQCGVWLVENPPRGGDAFSLSGVMLADRKRACKAHAASRSHPSSFFVHLHLNSACLRMPKQLTSPQSAERGVTLRRTTSF